LKNLKISLIKRNQGVSGKFLKLYRSLLKLELQISVDHIIIRWTKILRVLKMLYNWWKKEILF